MKNSNLDTMLLIILAIAVCFAEVSLLDAGDPQQTKTRTEAKQIVKQDDSMLVLNAHLEQEVKRLQQVNDSLQARLSEMSNNVSHLKKEQHEKINHLDSLNGHDLYGFFSRFKTADRAVK